MLNKLFHLFKIFVFFYLFFLIKFVYLFLWGWIKHDVTYWFDDAFSETLHATIPVFIFYLLIFIINNVRKK